MTLAEATAAAAIGSRVSLKTTFGEQCEGTLFTNEAGLIVLEQNSSSISDSKARYCVFNSASLAEFKVVGGPPSVPAGELPPMPAVNHELVSTREGRAVEKAKAEDANVCVSATAYAQSVFNELSKTMPAEWRVAKDGTDPIMLVMDAVMISSPYSPETCKARENEKKLAERVQKVLAGILKKVDAEYALR